jgi:hypothetical protein
LIDGKHPVKSSKNFTNVYCPLQNECSLHYFTSCLCYTIHFCNILPSILSISNWSFSLFSTWKFVASYECCSTRTTHLHLSPECHLMSSTAKMMREILLSNFSVLNIPLHSCSKIPPSCVLHAGSQIMFHTHKRDAELRFYVVRVSFFVAILYITKRNMRLIYGLLKVRQCFIFFHKIPEITE